MSGRVLWASPYVPWPLRTGGRLRIAHLARELAKGYEVALVATVSNDDKASDLAAAREALGAFLDPIVFVPHRPNLPWHAAFYGPDAVRSSSRPPLRAAVRVLARALEPRAIVSEHSYTFTACAGLGAPVVIDEQNRESTLQATLKASRLDAALTRAAYLPYERYAWRAARAVLACQEAEAEAARQAGARDVHLVPNGVDGDAFPFVLPSARPQGRVLFTGSFGHRPNAEAARWLAREVWPRVARARPDAKLALVGHAPPDDVRALACASIEIVASAPSMAPHFAAATVYASAVRAGAGTNLKTLEAAAAGLALVATPKAIDGHPLEGGRDCVLADSPEAFADALVQVLGDPAGCDARAASARAIVEARCTWLRIGEQLRSAFDSLLDAEPRAHLDAPRSSRS